MDDSGRPAPGILPEGVPLLAPVPGAGNRPEPLAPPAILRPAPGSPMAALVAGLGLRGHDLKHLAPERIAGMTGRAARCAAAGIAEALAARDALARAAGLDPGAFGPEDDAPCVAAGSVEEALRRGLSAGAGSPKSLDTLARRPVAMLAADARAAAAAVEAILVRFETGSPPRSAAEAREIFGDALLREYNRRGTG